MNVKFIWLIPTLGAFVVAGYLYPDHTSSPQQQQKQDSGTLAQHANTLPHTPATFTSSTLTTNTATADWDGSQFAPSLSDTEIDGALNEDANGNLIASIDIKDFFDYFLNAVGERDEAEVVATIHQHIEAQLSPNAQAEAKALLADYIAYQREMNNVMDQPLAPHHQQDYAYYVQVMSAAFEQLKSMRRAYFSPEVVDAFFLEDEVYGNYALASMQIQADDTLSDWEREQQLDNLKYSLPADMQVAEAAASTRSHNAQRAQSLYETGTSKAEMTASLADTYSAQEVNDLYAYYENETRWEERSNHYLHEEQKIQNSSYTDDEKSQLIESLRASLFSDIEVTRLLSEQAIAKQL